MYAKKNGQHEQDLQTTATGQAGMGHNVETIHPLRGNGLT
jgi:hypothetical protein